LIDWYLEQKEGEMQDIEQEYEKELITKLLRKLVKCYLLTTCFVGKLLLEMRETHKKSQESSAAVEGENVRVYYMVHPSVDRRY
ncbi:hypothetical protein BDZ97DRAFT_1795070, partial [Flammula alnicola]